LATDLADRRAAPRVSPLATLAALGVVFGDLGTSPLYTLQTVAQATHGHMTATTAVGVFSAIIWTLIVTVSIKYCLFVMRADHAGEGGILALMSLVGANRFAPGITAFAVMGLLGAALIYGDGAITPAISVLSALEGVDVVAPALKPYVMPAAVVVLLGLFIAQRYGTHKIGHAFGPVMLVWFVVIGVVGASAMAHHPGVWVAVNPLYAINFLRHAGRGDILILGGIFLCITGGEALYADMGHFGRGPIRVAWYIIVLPALLLSYAGQTALLLDHPDISGNPFFLSAPHWAILPLVGLATVATIIASQAIITGSFSMTRQAMQLGWLPGVSIRQTSDQVYGQIYVPVVNWLLMTATIAITAGFGSSDRLAGAYGTAVATTMLLTTLLLYKAMRDKWHWPWADVVLVTALFIVVDSSFFIANLWKVADGGWLPLALASVLFVVMITWRTGVDAVRNRMARTQQETDRFLDSLRTGKIPRVPGTTIFLTRGTQKIAPLIMDHARFAGVLPEHAVSLYVIFEPIPRIIGPKCSAVEDLGSGLWRITARFGFMEIPDLRGALREAAGLGSKAEIDAAHFIGTRDLVVRKAHGSVFGPIRMALFAFLFRNGVKVVDRFQLPPDRAVEVARQVEV
jgi:KUP system potassium uptake protein